MSFLALFWWKILFVFSNARPVLELMLCNQNWTKLDKLILLSSNCRAWALKLCEHLKKRTNHVFVFILPIQTLGSFSRTFSLFFFINISYPKSSINSCDEYHFSSIKNCYKNDKNFDFLEKFVCICNIYIFFYPKHS